MVGSDHFHQLWLDNMPQFLVGHAEQYDANWYNEEREFGLPRMLLPGQRDLSWHILRQGLDAGFDLAFGNELRVDHSISWIHIPTRFHRATKGSQQNLPDRYTWYARGEPGYTPKSRQKVRRGYAACSDQWVCEFP
jgi:hypothetical protein